MNRNQKDLFAKDFLSWILLALLTWGCGPAYPLAQPSSPSTTPSVSNSPPSMLAEEKSAFSECVGEKLGLQILAEDLSEGKDPSSSLPPNRQPFKGSLEATPLDFAPLYFKEQITLSKPLHLEDFQTQGSSSQKRLFFVWPDQFGGDTVLGATVQLSTLLGNNKWVKAHRSLSPFHDFHHQRWILPIADLFKDFHGSAGPRVSESATQVLSIFLVLTSGKKTLVEVRFRVGGPVS